MFFDYHDSDLTPEEMIAMAQCAFDDADLAGPIDEARHQPNAIA